MVKIQHHYHLINLLCKRLKNIIAHLKNQMIAEEQRILQHLQPLIKIIKDREELYFDALTFTSKNISSSSNDIDQIAIFNKFLINASQLDAQIVTRETQLFNHLTPDEDDQFQGTKFLNNSKQILRLSARVLEMLQTSVQKTRNTIFGQNGRIGIDFTRFKKSLHQTIRQQNIDLFDFIGLIVNFVKNKYRRQINRIRNYLNKLQAGQHVSLKDLFVKECSDASISPEQRSHRQNRTLVKPLRKFLKQPSPQPQSPSKRSSSKKVSQGTSKAKRTLNLKTVRRQQLQTDETHEHKQARIQKSATAALLLKFYSMMQLNKKQFLEDYVFQKQDQQKQRRRLITQLMQRNSKNAQQISSFYSRCQRFNVSRRNLMFYHNQSSEQNHSSPQKESSVNSKISLRTSFVISRIKGSIVLQSGSDRSDIQHNSVNNKLPFSRTIRNFSPSKKKQEKKQHVSKPKVTNPSKKIFIIKSPMKFDEEIIPKVQITNVGWVQPSLTGKDRSRKNQHIRLKKRNNPVPLDEKYLSQSFRLHQNQL